MKANSKRLAYAATGVATLIALGGCAGDRDMRRDSTVRAPATVSETAPARTGVATVPTGQAVGATGSAAPAPAAKTPSTVSETAPAATGPATTPTRSVTEPGTGATGATGTMRETEPKQRARRPSRG